MQPFLAVPPNSPPKPLPTTPSPPPPPPPSTASSSLHSHSLDTLSAAAAASPALSIDPSLITFILHSNPALCSNSLLNCYFDLSSPTLAFLAALDLSLAGASQRHHQLRAVLDRFEEVNEGNAGGEGAKMRYRETIGDLRGFREEGDPFAAEFFTLLGSVCDRMMEMYGKVKERKGRISRKLNRVRVYKKVSGFVFVGAFVAVVVCSAVAIIVGVSRLMAVLAMLGVSGPLVTVGIWLNTMWRKYEDEVKSEREVIRAMNVGSFVVVKDLDNIRVLVDRLEVKMESFLGNADMALRYEDAVSLVVEEIGKSVGGFVEEIRELMKYGEMCRQDVMEARTVTLKKIVKYPGYS